MALHLLILTKHKITFYYKKQKFLKLKKLQLNRKGQKFLRMK